MEFTSNLGTNFDECQTALPISADWWFDLLRTSGSGPSTSTISTNHDNFIVDCASTQSSFDSPTSSSGFIESPISYPSLIRSNTLPFRYNTIAQQQPQHISRSCSDHSTQVKAEVSYNPHRKASSIITDQKQRRRNQNRVAQRAYRDRKEQRVRELEDELAQCKKEYETLLHMFRSQQDVGQALRPQTTKLTTCITCLECRAAKDTAKKGETRPPQPEGT